MHVVGLKRWLRRSALHRCSTIAYSKIPGTKKRPKTRTTGIAVAPVFCVCSCGLRAQPFSDHALMRFKRYAIERHVVGWHHDCLPGIAAGLRLDGDGPGQVKMQIL